VFWAIREWFVASGTGEQVHVDAPFQEHLVAVRLELAARLSPKATVVLATSRPHSRPCSERRPISMRGTGP